MLAIISIIIVDIFYFKKDGNLIWKTVKAHGNIYKVGVERESLRCSKEGELSDLPHPTVFGDRMENDFITTDFGEAQLELRTPICSSTQECYDKLENITDVVICELNKQNELLWPYSMPCILPDEAHFPFGNYGKHVDEYEYEQKLYKKYGYKMHCISGIHVNFSINKDFYKSLRKANPNLPARMDDAYFKIMRQFMKNAWILIYFLGATPVQLGNKENSVLSLRNSGSHGFSTKKSLFVDFSSKDSYIESIEKLLNNKDILSAREVYIPIRAKSKDKNHVLEDLKIQNIDHIEVRLCDINPFNRCGITKNDLDLVVTFLFYCLLTNRDYELNYKEIAERGLTETEHLVLLDILKDFRKINKQYSLGCDSGIREMSERAKTGNTKAHQISELAKEKGLKPALLDLANTYSVDSDLNKYRLRQYPNLESSTVAVIKDAIKLGVDYNVINENQCFVEYKHNNRREYVVQATKTNKDSYIFSYITDDKFYAKKLMRENNIVVPNGIILNKKYSLAKIKRLIAPYVNSTCVVKPRTTNCGIGITVFNKPISEAHLLKAIKYAFQFDTDILIEEFAQGREFRFVVINGKCLNVVWRRSASVVGDGKSTIKELIDKKNEEQWHYLLDNNLVIDQPLKQFIKKNNTTFEDIPKKGERVFLRENSNCSTGGESVDMTPEIPDKFKKIAEKTAKIFDAHICGVDMIINDLKSDDYTIIEINDNPGICINEWPYEGKGEPIGTHILKLLKLV